MTLEELRATLHDEGPPSGLSPLLRALWLDARGDWRGAHLVAQDVDDKDGAWVHAYLHRKEGDGSNARYWYARADRSEATSTLDEEWTEIATALLS